MGLTERSLKWAIEYLTSQQNLSINNYTKIIDTAYSEVFKIKTPETIFFLKLTPPELFLEPATISFLHSQGCLNIPKVVAENADLNCFLMESCGENSLREIFDEQFDLDLLNLGITNFTKIQRCFENQTAALLEIGVPDWRLQKFPKLYAELIANKRLLAYDGLTTDEIVTLQNLHPTCAKLCEEIAEFNIQETINYCDFHDNNMLFESMTSNVNIIDWGEAVITHPFFSLAGCLWNIGYFHGVKAKDLVYKKLQTHCVHSWLDIYGEPSLIALLNKVNQLNGVFAALGYARLYTATKHQEEKVQENKRGSVAGCLRTYINNH